MILIIGILMFNLVTEIIKQKFYDIDPNILHAIAQVESDGNGWENKRIKIRFETHIFLTNCPAAKEVFKVENPSHLKHYFYEDYKWKFVHESQVNELRALDIAKQFCFSEAYNSLSIGTYQLNTINYQNIGFPSGFLMYVYMSESPERELEVLQKFIKSNKRLYQAMIDKNLETIAFYWNPYNETWLKEFVAEYTKLTEP